MTTELGKGYNPRSLAYYRQLYTYFPDWEILHKRVQNLTWSYLQSILGEESEPARLWYMKEAAKQMWSVKTLERNVGSRTTIVYYHQAMILK